MKHCPQCSFLYLDSDQLCDLDKTPLIADDLGSEVHMSEDLEQKTGTLTLTSAVHQRKLSFKTLSAATVAGLIIGLMLLLSYQRMRPTLQASQAPPTSQAQASQDYRASRVEQISREVSVKAAVAQQESDQSASSDETTPSTKPTATATSKTTPDTQPRSARLRISEKPVSTGDVTRPTRGPVTIRLANGSSVQADEVWRTKAGVWYRRKGIVTLVKANRVRAVSN